MPRATVFCVLSIGLWLLSGCRCSVERSPQATLHWDRDWRNPIQELQRLGISESCRDYIRTLPASWRWGFLRIENAVVHQGRAFPLLLFFYGNIDLESEQTPVVFINGGPGMGSWGIHRAFSEKRLRQGSLLFFDQRGTGCSTFVGLSREEFLPEDLYQFGSAAQVSDLELLRRELLGARRWRIFGHSYGGLVAHRYVLDFPDGLSGAYIYGFAVAESSIDLMIQRHLAFNRLFAELLRKNPTIKKYVPELMREVTERANCVYESGRQRCGMHAFDVLLRRVAKQNRWRKFLDLLNLPEHTGGPLDHSLNRALVYLELLPGVRSLASACREVHEHLTVRGVAFRMAAVDECRRIILLDQEFGAVEKFPFSTQGIDLAVLKNRLQNWRWPFVFYLGTEDAVMPEEVFAYSKRVLKGLARFRILRGAGHHDFARVDAIWNEVFEEQ